MGWGMADALWLDGGRSAAAPLFGGCGYGDGEVAGDFGDFGGERNGDGGGGASRGLKEIVSDGGGGDAVGDEAGRGGCGESLGADFSLGADCGGLQAAGNFAGEF